MKFRHRLRVKSAVLITLGTSILAILACGLSVWLSDRDQFATPFNGFWWALTTITTVGHGKITPHSVPGHIAGAILMILAVLLFAAVAAIFTSAFAFSEVEEEQKQENEEQTKTILARIDELEKKLNN
jgi:hypothetical protein